MGYLSMPLLRNFIYAVEFSSKIIRIGSISLLFLCLLSCDESPTQPGCTLNSDCIAPRICMSGVCMIECIESRDCNVGERCIESRCTPENEDQASDMDLSPECRLNSDCLFAHV